MHFHFFRCLAYTLLALSLGILQQASIIHLCLAAA